MVKRAPQDLLLYWSPETVDDVLRRERTLDLVAPFIKKVPFLALTVIWGAG